MLTEEKRTVVEDVLKTFEGLNDINKALLYAYGCGLLDAQKTKTGTVRAEEPRADEEETEGKEV